MACRDMARMADAPYTAVDLSRLRAPDVIETLDFETILAGAITHMQALMRIAPVRTALS